MGTTTTVAMGSASGARAKGDGVLRCGVVGVGRMGMHHARKYKSLEGVELVGVVDHDEARREAAGEELGCAAYGSEAELLAGGVDAVSVAVPTVYHLRCAQPFWMRAWRV